MTTGQAITHFGLGSWAPRTAQRSALNDRAERDGRVSAPELTPVQEAERDTRDFATYLGRKPSEGWKRARLAKAEYESRKAESEDRLGDLTELGAVGDGAYRGKVSSEWVTIAVAVLSGGLVGSVVTTYIRGGQERRSDMRKNILGAGSHFSHELYAAFGPTGEAIDKRFHEPNLDDEDFALTTGKDDDDDELDPREYWSQEMVLAYEEARKAFARAEAAFPPLVLLLPGDRVVTQSARGALSMLSGAIGALHELNDETSWSRLYLLQAQLEWEAFNNSIRREIRRAGRRVSGRTLAREWREHERWLHQTLDRRTIDRGAEGIHVLG